MTLHLQPSKICWTSKHVSQGILLTNLFPQRKLSDMITRFASRVVTKTMAMPLEILERAWEAV